MTTASRIGGRRIVSIGAALLCAAVAVAMLFSPDEEPRNVLLLTLDTTRADRLGCYGYERNTSPRLDSLAAAGVRFDFALSTSGITPVAHASILTGLTPERHGLRVFHGPAGDRLDGEIPTLAGLLRERGWSTAAFVSAYSASERYGLQSGFDRFDSGLSEEILGRDLDNLPREKRMRRERANASQRRADAVTDAALEWLDRTEGPYFLWVHYFDPHDITLIPPEEWTDSFRDRTRPDFRHGIYDAEVRFMDEQIGRILDRVAERGEADRTVIVALADHGQGLGDHGWWFHRLLYQEQIRVPFLLRVPGGPAGLVVDGLVRNVDLLPTLTDLLGVPAPEGISGRSLAGILDGKEGPSRYGSAEALNTLDVDRKLPAFHDDLLFVAMDRRWKLIHHAGEPANDELYDLREDPGETANAAALHPEERRRLLERIEKSGALRIETDAPAAPIDDEEREKLRALGYIGG